MLPLLWHKLDTSVRSALPTVLAIGFIFVGIVPWPLPGLSSVAPLFGLIAVHYWTVHRPLVMPAAAAFLLGLVQDLLGGGPIGLNALVLVLVHAVVMAQRPHLARRPFIVDLCGFAMVAAGAVAVTWLVACIYFMRLIGMEALMIQYFLTVCAYPAFAWLFSRLRLGLYRKWSSAAGI